MERSLASYSLWGCKESEMTEVTNTLTFKSRSQRFSSQEEKNCNFVRWWMWINLIVVIILQYICMYQNVMLYTLNIQCCMSIIPIKLEKKKREKKNDFLKLNILFHQYLCKVWTDLPLSFQVNSEVCFSFDDSRHYSQGKTNSQQV